MVLSTGLPVLTIPQTKEFLNHVAIRHRKPVMLWSSPGVGKTAAIGQLAIDLNAYLCDVRLGQYDSVDIRGFPGVENDRTRWYAPATLPFVGNEEMFPGDDLILLFLDEINSATQAVFAVAMQLLHEGRVGEHVLMDRVRIIAAGNREGDRGVANKMPTTVSNRMKHVEVVVDVDSYCYYRQERGCLPEEIAFYQFTKSRGLLNTFDPANPAKAFATPRSSEDAWLFYQDDEMPDVIKKNAMISSVGQGVATEIYGFLNVWKSLIPIEDIIANPHSVPVPEELSMQYAMSVNIAAHMNVSNVERLYTYLKRIGGEFVVLAWNLAGKRNARLYSTQSFLAFSREYKRVFNDSVMK